MRSSAPVGDIVSIGDGVRNPHFCFFEGFQLLFTGQNRRGAFIGAGSRKVLIDGGSARGAFGYGTLSNPYGWPALQRYGVFLDGDADYCGVLDAVDLTGNVEGPLHENQGANHNFTTQFIN